MNLMIKEHAGKRQWLFALDDEEIYEVLCTQAAWKLISSSGKSVEWVKEQIPHTIRTMREHTKEEVERIQCPFIRLISTELQRLQIRLCDDDE